MALTFQRTLPIFNMLARHGDDHENNLVALSTWINKLNDTITNVVNEVNILGGRTVRVFDAIAQVPTTFGAADAGTIVYVNDYAHFLRWTGTVWVFMDGGNRFIAHHTVAPGAGWALCDGSTQGFLVVGATLSSSTLTLPDLNGTASYLKSAAAYTGTLVAGAGSTAAEASHTHTVPNTDAVGNHQHSPGAFSQITNGTGDVVWRSDDSNPQGGHSHTFSSSTGAGSSHSHAIGSLDPAHLNMLPYFRQ